jgi:hypothetical protein
MAGRPGTRSSSGNPKGRPKGCQNIRSQLVKVFTDPIAVREGGKQRRVPALVALQRVLLQRALNGDDRAMQLLFKSAKELAVLDAPEINTCSCDVSREHLRRLSDEALDEFRRISKDIEAEKQGCKKPD